VVHMFRILIAVPATAIVVAAPASADEESYLQRLQPRLTFLTAEQLLSEGNKVCRASKAGMKSVDAVQMVQKDLAASVAAASDIVSAAVVELDC
jgi:hypothetical protein